MRELLLVILLVFTGCTATPQNPSALIEFESPEVILYHGEISPENVFKFESTLRSSTSDIRTLIITSVGGDVHAGMHFGKLIHEKKMDVVVRKVCASSCANYVATSGLSVYVEENALLGWHGGSLQPLYSNLDISFWDKAVLLFQGVGSNDLKANFMSQWQTEEKQFYDLVGVNQAITTIGIMPGLKEKRDAQLYSYDTKTLGRLGLNVQYEGEQTEYSKLGEKVVQIFNLSKVELNQLLILHNKALKSD